MPWTDNLLWDAAIEADPQVAIGIGFPGPDGQCGAEVLYRPGELLVERELWEADDHPLVAELRRSGAVAIAEVPRNRRDVERAEAASDLDLQLVYVRRRDPLGLLRDARRGKSRPRGRQPQPCDRGQPATPRRMHAAGAGGARGPGPDPGGRRGRSKRPRGGARHRNRGTSAVRNG